MREDEPEEVEAEPAVVTPFRFEHLLRNEYPFSEWSIFRAA